MAAREIRLGLTQAGRYSNHWTVSAKAGRPEFQIMNSAVHGGAFHVSIHDQAYGFHVRVEDGSGRPPNRYDYPQAIRPGAHRFLEVRMPSAAACRDAPRLADRIAWYEAPDDPAIWATFHVVVHDSDIDNPDWWRAAAAQYLVGDVPLVDGSTLLVLAGVMPGFDGEFSGRSESPRAAEVRDFARKGDAGAILGGVNKDDSIWFLDLPSPNSVGSIQAEP
jgi:hypothetical protein